MLTLAQVVAVALPFLKLLPLYHLASYFLAALGPSQLGFLDFLDSHTRWGYNVVLLVLPSLWLSNWVNYLG